MSAIAREDAQPNAHYSNGGDKHDPRLYLLLCPSTGDEWFVIYPATEDGGFQEFYDDRYPATVPDTLIPATVRRVP